MGNPGNDRRIDNIEFAVSDIARSREFYGKAFGWTFTDYGSDLLRVQRWAADRRPRQGRPDESWRAAGDPLCRRSWARRSVASKKRAQGSSNRFSPFPAADAFISMTWMDTNSPYGPTSRTFQRAPRTSAYGTWRTCDLVSCYVRFDPSGHSLFSTFSTRGATVSKTNNHPHLQHAQETQAQIEAGCFFPKIQDAHLTVERQSLERG